VDRHRFDADPDPIFHFDAYPEWKIRIFFTFINSIVSLHCFIFLVSVINVKIFNNFDIVLKFSGNSII
jgi:hypothetical protein